MQPTTVPIHEDPLTLLTRFLEVPGQVLLIQGSPGAGKTTLALELLYRLNAHKVYASSRVSPTKLRQHLPWLDEVVDTFTGRTARSTWVDEIHDFRTMESDNIFSKVIRLKHSKQRAALVVDSWEGAIRNSNDEGKRMLESALFSDLEDSKVSVIVVAEDAPRELGYLTDGIVTLSLEEVSGRTNRILTVNKMRGFSVPSRKCLFSLKGGRFKPLPGPFFDEKEQPRLLEPVVIGGNRYSTGISDLDALLGGGLEKGSFFLIDSDSSVPPQSIRILLSIIRANFIRQGGAAFIVPTGTYSAQSLADSLRPLVGQEALDERTRIADYNPATPEGKWRVELKGNLLEDVKTFYTAWQEISKKSPLLVMLDFDKTFQVYGEDTAVPGVAGLAEEIRDSKAVIIGVASRQTRAREDFLRTADYHVKLHNLEGTFILYGVKPYTSLFGAELSYENGNPHISLTEMV